MSEQVSTDSDPTARDWSADLGLRPMSARSILLSVLLGSHPPELPTSAVLSLAELFDIPSGTLRTALSRMAGRGEVHNDEGRYRLGERLVTRQGRQDETRRAADDGWNGGWWSVLVLTERRSQADRRSFRTDLAALRLGEIRPDTWMRPANLGEPTRARLAALPDSVVQEGPIMGWDTQDLVATLWPLDTIAAQGHRLHRAFDATSAGLDGDDPSVLPTAFTISAATIRFLRTEPQLPRELEPPDWPGSSVRARYDDYERRFQSLLHRFLTGDAPLRA